MDISSLLSSLSDEDIEKLKATAQQFFGGTEKNEREVPPKKEESSKGLLPDLNFDPGLLTGVAKFSQMMNERDEKSDFILALKPLLSDKRQKKADDAVMMLKFMRMISSLQENGK